MKQVNTNSVIFIIHVQLFLNCKLYFQIVINISLYIYGNDGISILYECNVSVYMYVCVCVRNS